MVLRHSSLIMWSALLERFFAPSQTSSPHGKTSCAVPKPAMAYGFEHVTSSPRFPQSNGEVERMVWTVKDLLLKSMILTWHCSPTGTLQVLMGSSSHSGLHLGPSTWVIKPIEGSRPRTSTEGMRLTLNALSGLCPAPQCRRVRSSLPPKNNPRVWESDPEAQKTGLVIVW
ncbi:uncharacterized protein LOC144161762 [Haemaphysalis longicornis]